MGDAGLHEDAKRAQFYGTAAAPAACTTLGECRRRAARVAVAVREPVYLVAGCHEVGRMKDFCGVPADQGDNIVEGAVILLRFGGRGTVDEVVADDGRAVAIHDHGPNTFTSHSTSNLDGPCYTWASSILHRQDIRMQAVLVR